MGSNYTIFIGHIWTIPVKVARQDHDVSTVCITDMGMMGNKSMPQSWRPESEAAITLSREVSICQRLMVTLQSGSWCLCVCVCTVSPFTLVERQPHSAAFLLYNKCSFWLVLLFSYLPKSLKVLGHCHQPGHRFHRGLPQNHFMSETSSWDPGHQDRSIRLSEVMTPKVWGFMLPWCVNVCVFTPKQL